MDTEVARQKPSPEKLFHAYGYRHLIVIVLSVLCYSCSSSSHYPHPDSHHVKIASTDIPYSKQFQMQKGDAYEFQLAGGKTISVWCERPELMIGEQRTASGLKTAWGEHPFKRPEPIEKQIGPNSYTYDGWKSYIRQGLVITDTAMGTSDYELYIDALKIDIIEDLKTADSLPVTIEIHRR